MKRKWNVLLLILVLALLAVGLSCTPTIEPLPLPPEEPRTDMVAPITPVKPVAPTGGEPIVTFVVTNNSVSSSDVVYVTNFYAGAEADAHYLVMNEADVPITPVFYYIRDTHIDDYSAVEGQGYVDAPFYIEQWVTVTPQSPVIEPNSSQSYVVAFTLPDNAEGLPEKFAFQVGVAIGGTMQLRACPWWLITMR